MQLSSNCSCESIWIYMDTNADLDPADLIDANDVLVDDDKIMIDDDKILVDDDVLIDDNVLVDNDYVLVDVRYMISEGPTECGSTTMLTLQTQSQCQ